MANSGTRSGTFHELLNNQSKTLDIQQYDFCLNEWKAGHEKKSLSNYVLAVLLFLAGLWAVWENSLFMAVLLLALAANFNRQSSHHILFAELMGSQRLLAMLLNKQSQDLAALQRQQVEGDQSKSLPGEA